MRRHRRIDYALKRMRESWLLKGSAVLSFIDYGGVIALVLAEKLKFQLAGMIVFISLASWFFLLGWFPILEDTIGATQNMHGRAWIGRSLEAIGIGCAVVVHVLMAAMIVYAARS
jgi:hypothetical protein